MRISITGPDGGPQELDTNAFVFDESGVCPSIISSTVFSSSTQALSFSTTPASSSVPISSSVVSSSAPVSSRALISSLFIDNAEISSSVDINAPSSSAVSMPSFNIDIVKSSSIQPSVHPTSTPVSTSYEVSELITIAQSTISSISTQPIGTSIFKYGNSTAIIVEQVSTVAVTQESTTPTSVQNHIIDDGIAITTPVEHSQTLVTPDVDIQSPISDINASPKASMVTAAIELPQKNEPVSSRIVNTIPEEEFVTTTIVAVNPIEKTTKSMSTIMPAITSQSENNEDQRDHDSVEVNPRPENGVTVTTTFVGNPDNASSKPSTDGDADASNDSGASSVTENSKGDKETNNGSDKIESSSDVPVVEQQSQSTDTSGANINGNTGNETPVQNIISIQEENSAMKKIAHCYLFVVTFLVLF